MFCALIGVFKSLVEWCLIVTTPDEVMLCALARRDGALRLIPTRFTLPTDEVPILSVCGTRDGRIFMGGYDGSLYEMDYEGLVENRKEATETIEERLRNYYDGTAPISSLQPDRGSETVAGQAFLTGKRAFSALFVGDQSRIPPRKCRKLNHSASVMSEITKHVLPDFLRKASASLIGRDSSRSGPLTQIVHDVERKCLYTLTVRGYLSVYDLCSKQLRAVSGIDTEKTARLYLSAVARGHMYPSHPNITFPGGGASAQAGVGGMDGARSIIKLADNAPNKATNVLTPLSIHVISPHESQKLSILVITAGGIRYYLSTLASLGGGSISRSSAMKLTLCHVRSPPSVDLGVGKMTPATAFDAMDMGGTLPSMTKNGTVVASAYHEGVSMIALGKGDTNNANGNIDATDQGNILVVVAPDSVKRKTTKKDAIVLRDLPGGVSETVSLPTEDSVPSVLPGGPILSVCAIGRMDSTTVLDLTLHSQTPTDGELSMMVPPYVPRKGPSKRKEQSALSSVATDSLGVVDKNPKSLVKANGATSSIALTVLSNLLWARPLNHGLRYRTTAELSSARGHVQQMYRISGRHGSSKGGFSSTAGGMVKSNAKVSIAGNSGNHKSVRLSPWLLRPNFVALNDLSVQHLLPDLRQLIAMNLGGMHYFSKKSILSRLAETLMSYGATNDERLAAFFQNYGYKQGCALCLALAIGCGPAEGTGSYHEELSNRAYNAALRHAHVPRLSKNPTVVDGPVVQASNVDPFLPNGYTFICSSLSNGATSLLSRLLRPIWFKPAVVVTETQSIRRQGSRLTTKFPAKVELLLDDESLEKVRRPLASLQKLMKVLFPPAVKVVPGLKPIRDDRMEVEDNLGGSLLTSGMLYHGSQQHQSSTGSKLSPLEAEKLARLIEERDIHTMYRLLSRTVQLLNLLSLLKRAQFMPDLPDVEWGLLHGLQVSQMVTTSEGQERIESMLNSLVSSQNTASNASVATSADADALANQIADQCYLYFSPGSRFAYLGFRTATEALGCPESSSRRASLSAQAVTHLKRAASYWHSAPMIVGRTMRSGESETPDQKAIRALHFDSPVAKAAALLMRLGEVAAVVDLCTITASNFGSTNDSAFAKASIQETGSETALDWESGLYHKRRHNGAAVPGVSARGTGTSNALILGANVTPEDAVATCHAIVLHNLVNILNSRNPTLCNAMLRACVESSDGKLKFALFAHLLATNNVEPLLQIGSKDVEAWLKKTKDTGLLWRYYMVQSKPILAGQLLWALATEMAHPTELEKRIEFLGKALNSYNAALAAGPQRFETTQDHLQRLVVEVRETLDVALIQQRTLRVIQSMTLSSKLDDDRLAKLQTTLVSVSDLYNNYAAPLNLFDVCLLILHSCRHNEIAAIETLWKSVLCEELLPCVTQSPEVFGVLKGFLAGSMVEESITLLDDPTKSGYSSPLFEGGSWVDRLRSRVVSLGKELFGHGADYVFPLHFLAANMEGESDRCLFHARGGVLKRCRSENSAVSGGFRPCGFVSLAAYDPSGSWCTFSLPPRRLRGHSRERGAWPCGGCRSADKVNAHPGLLWRCESLNALRRLWNMRSIIEVLEEWVVRASSGGRTKASRQLDQAVATSKLMSRIDTFKASFEAMGVPEARPMYVRLQGVERSLRHLCS